MAIFKKTGPCKKKGGDRVTLCLQVHFKCKTNFAVECAHRDEYTTILQWCCVIVYI